MKGYAWSGAPRVSAPESTGGTLPRWESIAVEAVGHVIEFWGFKHNQGRVWALLYLRSTAMTATQLEEELGLSKGAVSMLVRDLERWGVVHRVRGPGSGAWRYRAETDLVKMVSRVIEERELAFLTRIRAELGEARRVAGAAVGVGRERMLRLERMNSLAQAAERAVKLFLRTARLDVRSMLDTFRAT
ncbi:MAG TPA: MarR family transcriptional regulator [Myxococcaceae bacterium]|jgi:DNA-binding transcriptional regulator GbsR (MarR family)|nr:MarR family transcriptional regulator [Myxococcaceae bacterium]